MRHSLVPASYIILRNQNQILMSKRFQTGYMDGFYSFPAGHVESGETFTEAIIRESKEEINIDLANSDIKLVHITQRIQDQERLDAFFVATNWDGEIKNLEPEKCDDLSWFDLDNLPDNIIPYLKTVIKNIEKGIYYSEIY
jgi:8-oxo-dGTP diphosphatase